MSLTEVEQADRTVWIKASQEILDEMRQGWSRPLQVKAMVAPDGSWELHFQAFYDAQGNPAAPYPLVNVRSEEAR